MLCGNCASYVHPPGPVCNRCASHDLAPAPVSGRAVVFSYSINEYRWMPELEPPYVVAEVDLVEQDGLRLQTNIVGCEPSVVRIGMEVEVVFAKHGDAYVPLFAPAQGKAP